jgi:hypothetical protein
VKRQNIQAAVLGFAILSHTLLSAIAAADDWLKILSTQKLYANRIEVAVRYPYEPGYEAMVVVTINCNTGKTDKPTAMSPGLVKMIATRVCKS